MTPNQDRDDETLLLDDQEAELSMLVGRQSYDDFCTTMDKLLAITASEPSGVVPGVPTVTQAGFPALTFDGLVGLYGTRDMPIELRERIATDVREALADPKIVDRLHATGQEVVPGSAAEFAASIDKQRDTVAGIAKVLGIKAAQ